MKKRSLFAAVAMLIVSAVVLTSATYAWFASGSKADIETIGAQITNSDGTLLIATIPSGNDANWGVTLPYTAWLDTNGDPITGAVGANLNDNGQVYTDLAPLSADFSAAGAISLKKGSLQQITDPNNANYKKYNFVTGGAANSTDKYIDLPFYVKATVPCTITLTPTFASDINFIYGAVTAAPAASNYTTAEDQAAAASNVAYQVLGKSTATGYVPVVADTASITVFDADADCIVDAAEDTGANTVLKQGASNTIAPTANNVQFYYTQAMADAETAVECHLYIWAEGQDASCFGKITGADATLSVSLTKA